MMGVQDLWRKFEDHGGWWVVAQLVILSFVVMMPVWVARPLATLPLPLLVTSWSLMLVGSVCVVMAVWSLGMMLTPFPRPVTTGQLLKKGIFGFVRHPMYLGVICLALGWSLLRQSAPGMVLVVVLFIFFDRKATREERWLTEKYPDYVDYRSRVKKLLPGIY